MQEIDAKEATKPTRSKLNVLDALRVLIIAAIPVTFGVLTYYLVLSLARG